MARNKSKARKAAEKRPAETGTAGLGGALVVILLALGVEVDAEAVAAIVAGVAAVPAIITAVKLWWDRRVSA